MSPEAQRASGDPSSSSFLFLLLFFFAAPAFPWGFEPGRTGAGVKLGAAYPTATNAFDTMARSGPAGGFSFFYLPVDWFQLGAELDGFRFRKGADAPPPGSSDPRLAATTVAGLVTGRVNLVSDRPWTVYVLGGGGAHHTFITREILGQRTKPQGSGLAVVAGGGAEAFVLKNVSVDFEARFHEFRLNRSRFGFDSAEGLVYLLGLNYWFQVE